MGPPEAGVESAGPEEKAQNGKGLAGERSRVIYEKPVPVYLDEATRLLSERLEEARERQRRLRGAGADTGAVDREIQQLRREMREGGQLRAGDWLGDGRYLLLEPIGRGGFSIVWRAHDSERRLDVAIKVLHAELAGDSVRRERFFRGARRMVDLAGDGVVRVLDPHGEDGGYFYIVMELISGGDLRRAVIEKRVRGEAVIPLILRVGGALARAHARGLVHRDIKPSNILLDAAGSPWLTDFDLVGGGADSTGGTRSDAVLGTMGYAAPELLLNAQGASPRADVYGLAMTALFGLHGAELRQLMVYGVAEGVRQVLKGAPCGEAVKKVLSRAVSLDEGARYADAGEFCDALREAWEASERVSTEGASEKEERARSSENKERQNDGGPITRVTRKTLVKPPKLRLARIGLITAAILGVVGAIAAFVYEKEEPPMVALAGATVDSPPMISAAGSGGAVAMPASSVIEPAPATPDAPATCPDGMVRFRQRTDSIGAPAGDGDDDEHIHMVTVGEYCLDRTEVTVDQYSACVNVPRNGLQCKPAKIGAYCNGNYAVRGDHPINCIQWTDADTYCKWAGGRLPTEAEWELAAKGRSPFPAHPSEVCWNGVGNELGDGKRRGTCPVKHYNEGDTMLGLWGMSGNVSEWVADWYAEFPKAGKEPVTLINPTGPPKSSKGQARVYRGGSFLDRNPASLRLSNRNYFDASKQSERIGFRCARSPLK